MRNNTIIRKMRLGISGVVVIFKKLLWPTVKRQIVIVNKTIEQNARDTLISCLSYNLHRNCQKPSRTNIIKI